MNKKTFISYRDWSFKKKLLVIISTLIIAIIGLISSCSYILYSRNFMKQTVSQTQQIIEQVAINVNTYLDELFRLSLSPYYNDEIMQELEDEHVEKTSSLYRKRTIEDFLASVMTLPRSEILRVYILTDYNLYAYTRTPYDMQDYNNYRDTDWYQQALKTSTPIFIPVHSEKVFGDKPTQIISFARRIRSKENNSKVLAVIKVDADYSGIKSICDQVQMREKGSLFIVDDNKNIVYQNNNLGDQELVNTLLGDEYNKDGNYTKRINSDKYIINVASLSTSDLKVIAINSYRELNKDSIAIRNTTILYAFLGMILALSILFIFVQRFFKPLFHMVGSMKQVQNGDLSVQVEVKNNDEIGYLAVSFNKMILRISEILEENTQLVKEVYESRYLQKEAQYNILCSQIKPHFLYNTLNTISLLIKCNDTRGAVLSIEKLSYFLRGIMNADKNVSISVELAIVDSYLGIQKARFGDDLHYEINVLPEYLEYQIPALTLQPLVENAIVHGCEVKRGKSVLQIYSSVDENHLNIHILDNGAGIAADKLSELNDELAAVTSLEKEPEEPIFQSESIGLINVNKRIKLKYGNEYGLYISSTENEGTEVTLRLPLTQNPR
jgi:two-component system sensor histidine kinase YesM